MENNNDYGKKTFRSLIKQYFPVELLIALDELTVQRNIDNNSKTPEILKLLDNYNVPYSTLGNGTNRYGILVDGYAVKIALDVMGKTDNKREFKYSKEMRFYQDLLKAMTGVAKCWFKSVLEKNSDAYFLLRKKYLKDDVQLKKELMVINEMINNLPQKPEPLAIFAARFTQNPHYLDFDGTNCTLFFKDLGG